MQWIHSACLILITVISASGTSSRNERQGSYPGHEMGQIPSYGFHHNCEDHNPDNLTDVNLYDEDGEVCLQAHLSMKVLLDDDDLVEFDPVHSRRIHEIQVNTSNYEGKCEGEHGVLAGENVTGPAVAFTWSDTDRTDQVLLLWKVENEETFIHTVKIKLIVREGGRMKHLIAQKEHLKLFPTSIGTSAEIFSEEVRMNFTDDGGGGKFIFRKGNYTIGALTALSQTMVVALVLALGVLMAIGALFYRYGGRKKKNELVINAP